MAAVANYHKLTGFKGFPGGSEGKESTCNAGDPGLIPGRRRFPGEGTGNPVQYPLEIPWTEEPGGLQSTGSQRVGHDRETNICTSSCKPQKLFFLFKNVFIFSWRIIALQNCVGFCHTSTWRQRKFIVAVLDTRSLTSRCHRGLASSRDPWRQSIVCGSQLLGAAHTGWRPPRFSLSLHPHLASSSGSPAPLCFSLTKTLVVALWCRLESTWVIQKDLISRFFTLLHLQRLFTSKVVFRGSRDQYASISWGHSSPHYNSSVLKSLQF